MTDGERFHVPKYQRDFSWEIQQHEELWDTLLSILDLEAKAGEKPVDTYFGTVYVARASKGEEFEIIDGQQRFATVSILLNNIRKSLIERLPEVDGELKEYAEHVINVHLEGLIYRQKGPQETPFIELNDHDDPYFSILFEEDIDKVQSLVKMDQYDGRKKNAKRLNELFDIMEIPEEAYEEVDSDTLDSFRYFGDSHKRLVEADKFYEGRMEKYAGRKVFDTAEKEVRALLNLAHYILRSLRVAECIFETDNQELRIEVFQSLNDRGIELSNMDKIRARIVGRFQGESDSETQIQRWKNVKKTFSGDADDVEEFIVHYLAATEQSFQTATEARENMLEAFRLKQFGHRDIKSRLGTPGEARDFLEELENYAQRYYEITTANLTDEETELRREQREECEAILRRLNKLNTSQWRPFVMYVYQAVTEVPKKDDFFLDVLRTVENITFRVALSPHVATVVDSTYPESCQEFIKLEQSNEQFDAEKISEILIDNIDSSARQLFGDSFIDVLISKDDWRNNQTKQFFLKLADEDYRERNETGITKSELSSDSSEVHIEHIMPRGIFLKNKENPYAWLEHFFRDESGNQLESQIDYLKERDAHTIDESDSRYDEIEGIMDNIEERFIRDIGNMMLLYDEVNTSVKNRLFSVKIREYHLEHEKDLGNLINRYFKRGDNISEDEIDKLIRLDMPEDETKMGQAPDIVQEFNKWWTYERMVDRKTKIINSALDSLNFAVKPDEFNQYSDKIEELVRDDIETRLTVMTV